MTSGVLISIVSRRSWRGLYRFYHTVYGEKSKNQPEISGIFIPSVRNVFISLIMV